MSDWSQKLLYPGAESDNDLSFGGLPIKYDENVPEGEMWLVNPDGTIVKYRVKREEEDG